MTTTPATDKQLSFITTLATSRDLSASMYEPALKAVAQEVLTNPASLTKAAASKAIDMLTKLPYLQAKTTTATTSTLKDIEAGFYELDSKVYKVQQSPTSGYLYAKVFTEHGFEYVAGAVNKIKKAGQPLTLEAAKQYGHVYGMCVICGRTLTDEGSIAAGIGPICAAKF